MKMALFFVVPVACLFLTNFVCNLIWPNPGQTADNDSKTSENPPDRLTSTQSIVEEPEAPVTALASTNPVERERARRANQPVKPQVQVVEVAQEHEHDDFDPSVHGGLPAGFSLADLRTASE